MTRQFTTFYLRGLYFGIDVAHVREVIRCLPLTRVPTAPPVVLGLVNLRGQIVTTLDLRRRLLLDSENAPPPSPIHVIVETSEPGEGIVSLRVDEIGDVIEVDEALFELPPATLHGIGRELIRGCYKLPDRLLLILDIERTVGAWADDVTPAVATSTLGPTQGSSR
ncbi:MAG TPA: chemotaxis protein CheW [Polyangia bacterium]|nr:chemotaxis protein CheW [Polyangia bacterium]